METQYPHNPSVVRCTPFPGVEGKGNVAYVGLAYGPIRINAKLTRNEKGGLFLSMPKRKPESGDTWYELASIVDRTLLEEFERMAILAYHEAIANQFLVGV